MRLKHLTLTKNVSGLESDYYVATGMNCNGSSEFPERRFFWCNSQTLKFAVLEAPKCKCSSIFDQIQCYFTGEHQKVLVDSMGFSSVCQLRAGSFKAKDIPTQGLTELDRLSYVVHYIDNHCTIVPVGSFKRTPIGEIQKNEAFRGLRADASACLCSYMHLRKCKNPEKQL